MEIYVDGGIHKSRICLYDPSHDRYVVKHRKGNPTNNELEYLAILFALEYTRGMTYRTDEGITIYSDSLLAVNQLNYKWQIKNERLQKLNAKCIAKLGKDYIKFVWIPRLKNPAGIRLESLLNK